MPGRVIEDTVLRNWWYRVKIVYAKEARDHNMPNLAENLMGLADDIERSSGGFDKTGFE